MRKLGTRIILLSILLISFGQSYGQDLTTSQIQNVQVDELSDEQIANYWQQAQEQGYTLEELESIALARGMSALQVAKLKRRIRNLELTKQGEKDKKQTDLYGEKLQEENPLFGLRGRDTLSFRESSPIFGKDFFTNPNISFTPNLNLATPENYQIGPGDVLQIEVYGAAENSYELAVSPEGTVRIPNLGLINLNGLSLTEAKAKINSSLSRIYSGIRAAANSPYKVFTSITVGEIRTVSVNVIGEVEVPGTYALNGLSTVLNALYAAGGPKESGTFREIRLVRNGEEVAVFDMYDYLINGSQQGNLTLKDQDVIIVKPYINRVEVEGAVKREGYYELRAGENFANLMNYFGGYTGEAYRDLAVVERIEGSQKVVLEVSLRDANLSFEDGDKVIVNAISDRFVNRVSIGGAVYNPGSYEYMEGLTVGRLIDKALGVRKDAFLNRGVIYRTDDGVNRSALSFNVGEVLNDQVEIFLRKSDSVHVYNKNTLREKRTLTINGAVNSPQTIPFIDSLNVADFIALADGFNEGANPKVIDIFRRINDGEFETLSRSFQWSSTKDLELTQGADFYLEPFDRVSVRYLEGFAPLKDVEVQGEVSFPGVYTIVSKDERVSDLVRRAGGLSPYAYVEGATLIRKKTGKEEEQQEELLEDLAFRDSIVDVKEDDQEFRIGINLKEILEDGGAGSKYDIILNEGDVLSVPSKKQTVEVRGEVLAPSLIRFDKGKGLKQYINGSGGFTSNAKKNKVYVIYANGDVKATSSFLLFRNYPRLEPGAVILVPPKPESKGGLSIQEIVALTTGLGTIGLIIDRLSN
ncbi:SLBB domain-containing protein [Croceiramulus getboli]|nr:SLBB domain-containing protein [Flavobacteriaceae bacterium YJPT1-3]